MRYRALDVYLGPKKRLVGRLFQYGTGSGAITRLNPEKGFWADDNAPVLSQNALVDDPIERATFVAEYDRQPFFNGVGEGLPPFFKNLLPEGPLRRHLELIGKVDSHSMGPCCTWALERTSSTFMHCS